MPDPVESVIHAFMMSTGDLEPVWDTVEYTNHNCKFVVKYNCTQYKNLG